MIDIVSNKLPIITDVNPIPWFVAREDLRGKLNNSRFLEEIGVVKNRILR